MQQQAVVEVIVGGMYSGKTEELIRRLRRAGFARQKIQVFKPMIDSRYHATDVTSHNQNSHQAVPVKSALEILDLVQADTQVVGIDEGQFFDQSLAQVCTELAERGLRVLVAGLDTDWLAKPFGPMPELMAIADEVTKQHAVCVVCGGQATRTQRVSIDEAVKSEERILVGSHGMYEARCRKHFAPKILPAFLPQEASEEILRPQSVNEMIKLVGLFLIQTLLLTVPMTLSAGLDPKSAPAKNFDLSLWKLTLPVDSSGDASGTAVEIKPIDSNYQHKEAFFTGADGAMVFRASALGATTSGSKYPRSELREMTASYSKAAWTIEKGGSFSAELAVNELPVKSNGTQGRIVIGQIHGPNDELCRLYYDKGILYYINDKSGTKNFTERKFILKSLKGAHTAIKLNARFSYSIQVEDGILRVSAIHNRVKYESSEQIGKFWSNKALYFKTGVYIQVGKPGSTANTTGSGFGQVSFYKLSRPSH